MSVAALPQPRRTAASVHAATSAQAVHHVMPRRFALHRTTDVSGVSGVGIVAFGTWYPTGRATLAWCSGPVHSVSVYDSVSEIEQIHGHDGATAIEWIDGD